jgi:hypothetical protein
LTVVKPPADILGNGHHHGKRTKGNLHACLLAYQPSGCILASDNPAREGGREGRGTKSQLSIEEGGEGEEREDRWTSVRWLAKESESEELLPLLLF